MSVCQTMGSLVRKVTEDFFRLNREHLCKRGWNRASKGARDQMQDFKKERLEFDI